MVMLVPLGVLAIGAVFSGMVWYGSFFGDHAQVNRFFGITNPAVAAMDADTHATAGVAETAEASEQLGETAQDVGAASLAAGAAIFGYAPEGAIFMTADNHVMDAAHHAPVWVKLSPFIAMLLGFVTACWFYIWDPEMPKNLAKHQRPVYMFLLNKWYFDEIFDFLFVSPAKKLGRFLWQRGDGGVIDGTLNGVAMGIIPFFTRALGIAQSGYIFTYALAMVLGLVAFLAVMMTRGGGF
jgi:NADH-quinone oxidoreductase subunit L